MLENFQEIYFEQNIPFLIFFICISNPNLKINGKGRDANKFGGRGNSNKFGEILNTLGRSFSHFRVLYTNSMRVK